jgi:hypothetical protein
MNDRSMLRPKNTIYVPNNLFMQRHAQICHYGLNPDIGRFAGPTRPNGRNADLAVRELANFYRAGNPTAICLQLSNRKMTEIY